MFFHPLLGTYFGGKNEKVFGKIWKFSCMENAVPRVSRYARKMVFLHKLFPSYRLDELRRLSVGAYEFSKKHWIELSATQKTERILSLEVARALRHNEGFKETIQRTGISKSTLLKNLGKKITKKGKKWKISKTDTIEVEMNIYEKDIGMTSIVVRNSKDRRLIGQYFADVKKALRENNPKILKKYKRIILKDAQGNKHKLETDLDKIYEIQEKIEEIEAQEIYKNGGR